METNFSLYCTIRLEDKKGKAFGDTAFESNKDSFSSDHVRGCIRTLLNHKILKEAFDPLLEVPGMQPGMRFSTLHKLCCSKSDEEAAAYLRHTFNSWLKIALGNLQAIKKIDIEDVQALELRCPKLCSRDAADIEKMFDNENIFTAFKQEERKVMKERILSIDYIIPSLRTFFQDVHLLELCAASMRHIVTPCHKMTIRATLRSNYEPLRLEQSAKEKNSSTSEASTTETGHSFDIAMELLWVFVLGEFQRMPPPNKGTGGRLLSGYLVEKPHISTLFRLAKLAQKLGFKTPEIIRLSQLTTADDSEHPAALNIDSQWQLTSFLSQNANFANFFSSGHPIKSSNGSVARSPASHARVLRQRCGRPKHDLYQYDRVYLTKELIHFDYGVLGIKSQDITSFLVLRSQCLSFFSCPREELDNPVTYEPATASINTTATLKQSRLADSADLTDILGQKKISEISEASHNGGEDKTPPEEWRASSPKPVSNIEQPNIQQPAREPPSTKFQFILYENGQFKTFVQVDASDTAGVERVAQEIIREHGMKLYNLSIHPIDVQECFSSTEDMHNVIILPKHKLTVTEELRDAAKAYRLQEQNAARQLFRR